jgi:hypothetical protein
MPRTYIFTIALTVLITIILYRAFEFKHIEPYEIVAVLCMVIVLYVNEKTALFENMISCRIRRVLSYLAVAGLAILALSVVLFLV